MGGGLNFSLLDPRCSGPQKCPFAQEQWGLGRLEKKFRSVTLVRKEAGDQYSGLLVLITKIGLFGVDQKSGDTKKPDFRYILAEKWGSGHFTIGGTEGMLGNYGI